jgi:hypothetical protein
MLAKKNFLKTIAGSYKKDAIVASYDQAKVISSSNE